MTRVHEMVRYDTVAPQARYDDSHGGNSESRGSVKTSSGSHGSCFDDISFMDFGSCGENLDLLLHDKTATTTAPSDDSLLLPPPVSAKGTDEPRKKHPFLSGWRLGALFALGGATLVFVLNLVLLIWVLTAPNHHVQDGIGTLFEGSYATMRHLNIVAHLVVNILSTLLLSASNYCMQILCSPNRKDVDCAHAQRLWLHIGIPSIHNLKFFGGERSFLWVILLISSLPLHLFYNSVFFTNLQANSYVVVPTMDNWLLGGAYNSTNFFGFDNDTSFEKDMDTYRPILDETIVLKNGSIVPRYKNISTEECFESYDTHYPSEVGNVYIAQDEPTTWHNSELWNLGRHNTTGEFMWFMKDDNNETLNFYSTKVVQVGTMIPFQGNPSVYPSSRWRCPPIRNSTCDLPRKSRDWKPYGSSVKYCLIEQVAERCKLQFSFLFMSIVLVSNVVKVACIARLLFRHGSHCALVTLGDTVASFLERTDVHTEGRCLPSEVQIDRAFINKTFAAPKSGVISRHEHLKSKLDNRPRAYKPERLRWSSASSYGTWFVTYLLFATAVFIGVWSIVASLVNSPKTPAQLWEIGFGSVDGTNVLSTQMSLFKGVLTANIPQLILSYLYVAFNRLFTGMLLGKEWSSYLHKRKTLRVTSPVGQQRSTYWLSVPHRYGVPIVMISGLFHWLASQCVFLVQITVTETYKDGPRRIVPTEQISTCGFSPFAIILTTVLATTIAVGGILVGRLKYPAGMPLASSCSAVMSAACHPPSADVEAHMLPVQWGAVCHGSPEEESADLQIGHCCFTSWPVETPIPGRLYA